MKPRFIKIKGGSIRVAKNYLETLRKTPCKCKAGVRVPLHRHPLRSTPSPHDPPPHVAVAAPKMFLRTVGYLVEYLTKYSAIDLSLHTEVSCHTKINISTETADPFQDADAHSQTLANGSSQIHISGARRRSSNICFLTFARPR